MIIPLGVSLVAICIESVFESETNSLLKVKYKVLKHTLLMKRVVGMKEENLIYIYLKDLEELRGKDAIISNLMAKYEVFESKNVYVDSYLNDAKPSLEQMMLDAKVMALQDKQPRIICFRLWDLFPKHKGESAIEMIDYYVENHINIFDDFTKEDVTGYQVTSENQNGYSKIRQFLEEMKLVEEAQKEQINPD